MGGVDVGGRLARSRPHIPRFDADENPDRRWGRGKSLWTLGKEVFFVRGLEIRAREEQLSFG